MKNPLKMIVLSFCCFFPLFAGPLDKTGTLWAPYLEWSFDNSSYSGNPFDLIATATFTHSGSSETRTTEMFYNGNNTWKMRFTATKTGAWTFITSSSDGDLNGHSGTVTINPNTNPDIKGFLATQGNKYVRQAGENGELEGFLFNVFMDHDDFPSHSGNISGGIDIFNQSLINAYLNKAESFGFNTIFTSGNNEWFKLGAMTYDDHSSENPDLQTFQIFENMITAAHGRGMTVHFWAWGDEDRHWTPVGVGGINGMPDRRLQRYIAARLGPLPGWTMGYGFDLQEWTSENQMQQWAQYMHQHMGWNHLLCARGRSNSELNFKSYSNMGPRSYSQVVSDLNSDANRPHFYEERDLYTRSVNMEQTRSQMWLYAMAGGMGGFWGIYWGGGPDYPNPEQLITHNKFWKKRFLVDMQRANSLTNGYCIKTPDNANYVFYRENTNSIQLDLSNLSGTLQAIAIDIKQDYSEINITSSLSKSNQTWTAPYSSTWAIAVGELASDPSVKVKSKKLPKESFRFKASPNPLNPSTRIQFHLAEKQDVEVAIFNLKGERVAVLAKGRMARGLHTHKWDATGFASGIYCAKLTGYGKNCLTKLTLIR